MPRSAGEYLESVTVESVKGQEEFTAAAASADKMKKHVVAQLKTRKDEENRLATKMNHKTVANLVVKNAVKATDRSEFYIVWFSRLGQ